MHLNRPLCFHAVASGLVLIAAMIRVGAAEPPRLQIKQTEEAVFPHVLLDRGIISGEVWVAITLDANGQLTDALPSRYTARPLADEALRLLRKWTFQPVVVNGQPVPVSTQVHLTFQATGCIVTLDPVLDLNRKSLLPGHVDYECGIYQASELDCLPTPVRQVQPVLPDTTPAPGGTVTIEFIIDEQGHPRMPILISAPSPEIGNRMGNALMQWEFAPPTRNGKPVAVRVRQQFVIPH